MSFRWTPFLLPFEQLFTQLPVHLVDILTRSLLFKNIDFRWTPSFLCLHIRVVLFPVIWQTSHDCAVSHCKECILGWGCNEVYFCLDEQLVITASPGDQLTKTPKLFIHFLLFRGWIHVSGVQCNDQAHHFTSENKPVSGNYSSTEVINSTSWHRRFIINTYTACIDNFILLIFTMIILLKITYFLRCSRFNDQLATRCQFKHGSWHWLNFCPREIGSDVIEDDDDTAKLGTLAKLATQRPRL